MQWKCISDVMRRMTHHHTLKHTHTNTRMAIYKGLFSLFYTFAKYTHSYNVTTAHIHIVNQMIREPSIQLRPSRVRYYSKRYLFIQSAVFASFRMRIHHHHHHHWCGTSNPIHKRIHTFSNMPCDCFFFFFFFLLASLVFASSCSIE